MRHPRSMPNLNDARSDISGFTASSGGSRLLGRPYSCGPERTAVAQVTANFQPGARRALESQRPRPAPRRGDSTLSLASDTGSLRRSASSYSVRSSSRAGSRSLAGEGYSHIVDRYTAQGLPATKPVARNLIDVTEFNHVPSMLLPRIHSQTDMYTFMSHLKENTVVPADPITPMMISGTPDRLLRQRASSAVSSISHVSTDLEEDIQDTDDSGYIDSFVDLREVKRKRKENLRARFEAKLRRKKEELEKQQTVDSPCPHCQALYDKHGGKANFLDWFWGRWDRKTTIEPVDNDIEDNKIDLVGKAEAPPSESRKPRRSRVQTPPSVSERDSISADTGPVRVWLGDDDEEFSTGVAGRVIEASSTVSDSSLLDAASLTLKIRSRFSPSKRSDRSSKANSSTGVEDLPDEDSEEIDLVQALHAIRSSSIKLSSDEESDHFHGTRSGKKSLRSRARRLRWARRGSPGPEGEEVSDYSSSSDSEYSEGGTRYSSSKSSVRVPSATAGSWEEGEDVKDEEEGGNQEEEEDDEDDDKNSAFGDEELFTKGEAKMDEAMLSFKYYEEDKEEAKEKEEEAKLDDDELTEEQIEQIAYRNASSLAMSGWTGNSKWKKPVRRYTLCAPIKPPTPESEPEEDSQRPAFAPRPNINKRRQTYHGDEVTEEGGNRAAFTVAALPDARFRQRGSGLWGKSKSVAAFLTPSAEKEEEEETQESIQEEAPEVAEETQTEEIQETPEVPPLPEIPEPEVKVKKKRKPRRTHPIQDSPDPKTMGERLEADYKYTFNFKDITSTMDNDKTADELQREGSDSLSSYSTTSCSRASSVWSGCAREQEEVIDVDELIRSIKAEEAEKARMQSWLAGRLALSQQASRFELPMDMKRLETMTPEDYLSQFCVITSRRATLYNKVFSKYKDKQGKIGMKDLDRALREVLINTITPEEISHVIEFTSLEENSRVDVKLFSGLAAMAERILYPKYVTDDTVDIPDHKKEKIESADFSALKWKFSGVEVNSAVKKILENL